RNADIIAHGITRAQKTASPVPTQFAFIEFQTSPRTNRAKLVVIPHDGHGIPVISWNRHGGMPSVWCDASRMGVPSALYGCTRVAMKKTKPSPAAIASKAPRTHQFARSGNRGNSSILCSVGGTM